MSKDEKNVQPDRDSSPGPLAYSSMLYRLSYPGAIHILSPITDKVIV